MKATTILITVLAVTGLLGPPVAAGESHADAASLLAVLAGTSPSTVDIYPTTQNIYTCTSKGVIK